MNNTPYFSIIIPMYNAQRYIKVCVDSILAQTFQDFEIIIVDDCSTDNSYQICQKLYGNHKKVRLFRHEKNQGQGSARNTGIKISRGEYIWFIDNDDVIIPNAIEKLYKVTQTDGEGVNAVHCLGHYKAFQDDDKPLDVSKLTLHWENREEGFLEKDVLKKIAKNWLNNRIDASTWLGIYKKELLVENGIEFPDCRADDVPIAFAGICFAEKYFMFRDALYIWRQREDSLSHSKNIKQLCNSIKSLPILLDSMEKLMNKIPEIARNRMIKEQCIIQIWEILFRDHVRPLYDGANISAELDKAVYETMLPIFGENTTLVKYLFHGFNTMWRQTNILAQQNYLLSQRENLIQQQNKLIEQLQKLLDQQQINFKDYH